MESKYASAAQRVLTVAAVSFACSLIPVEASETNGSPYPLGVETNFSGVMLPEGLNKLLFFSHYTAEKTVDRAGDRNANINKYEVEANALALRFSYVWPGVKWLGANVETRVVLVAPSVDLTLDVNRPGGLPPLDRGGSTTALGDTYLAPVMLGWHSPTLHQITGVETFLPTGEYDADEPVNAGRNHFQIAPFYAVTWLPNKNWETTAKIRYAFNTTNRDTDYRSGDEFALEFSGGYRLTDDLSMGVNGYWLEQTRDDKFDGRAVSGGNRTSVKAVGPYVSYRFTPKFIMLAKWQEEFDAKNRSEGSKLWLQARLPF